MTAQNNVPTGTSADDRSTEFQPVREGEQQSGEMLLVQAYVLIWLLVFGLVAVLWRKQKRLHERLDAVDRALERALGESPKG